MKNKLINGDDKNLAKEIEKYKNIKNKIFLTYVPDDYSVFEDNIDKMVSEISIDYDVCIYPSNNDIKIQVMPKINMTVFDGNLDEFYDLINEYEDEEIEEDILVDLLKR